MRRRTRRPCDRGDVAVRRGSVFAVLSIVVGMMPLGASAQECTYAACALRLQGRNLVAGAQRTTVTKLGRWSNPELRPWMVVSDSTEHYVGIVEENWKAGRMMETFGLVAAVVGFALIRPFEANGDHETQDLVGLGLLGGGLGLGLRGSTKTQRARDALHTAIWYYNGTLEGGPVDPAGVPVEVPGPPPDLGPTHHGRRGAILGSLAGAGTGLTTSIVSEKDPAESVGWTVVGAGVGGLLGYVFGKAIPR